MPPFEPIRQGLITDSLLTGFSQEVVDNPDGFTAIVLKAHPSSRGFVRLTGSHPQDPLDIQKMHFEAEQGPDDVQALVDGLMRIRTLVETSPMAAFVDEEVFPGTNASLTEHVFERVFGHHACCTNPIGTGMFLLCVDCGWFIELTIPVHRFQCCFG